jgi:hypothetical protein
VNTADYIKREANEISARTGRYIPPYRMVNLMKSAQKIADFLVKADLAITYEECETVLNIVLNTIRAMTGKNED